MIATGVTPCIRLAAPSDCGRMLLNKIFSSIDRACRLRKLEFGRRHSIPEVIKIIRKNKPLIFNHCHANFSFAIYTICVMTYPLSKQRFGEYLPIPDDGASPEGFPSVLE
jgi:hypothetical protein